MKILNEQKPKIYLLQFVSILVLMVFMVISCEEEDTIVQSLFDLSGAPLRYDDSNANRHLNILTVSMTCSKEKEENIEKICSRATEAKKAHPEAELILFGESVLGWYIDDEQPEPYQQSIAEVIVIMPATGMLLVAFRNPTVAEANPAIPILIIPTSAEAVPISL